MSARCHKCHDGGPVGFDFSMAFQPIVDVTTGHIFAHEALVRGPNGEGAGTVLSQVGDDNRYAFDQLCRVKAIELASKLYQPDDGVKLSINFMPNAVNEPRACVRTTLLTALKTGFPLHQIIFEFTENEQVDPKHLLNILTTYREMGFTTALDDFGAGHSGIGLLADFQPDIVKLDMNLVRGIDKDPIRQAVVGHTLALLEELRITPLCEGVETEAEFAVLKEMGVKLMQGYLIAKPRFEGLASPAIPGGALRLAG